MNIKITYPADEKRGSRRSLMRVARWPFLSAAFVCAVVNLCVGGKAWSAVVIWSLFALWNNVIAPDLVDYNRLHQGVKGFLQLCVLLLLIDVCLAPGKLMLVFPIVSFGTLTVLGVLFFTDLRRQRRNVMPVFLLALCMLVLCTVGAWIWETWHWTVIVMAATAFALIMACAATLGEILVSDVRKYFHLY